MMILKRVFFLIGLFIIGQLLFNQKFGLDLFWNILIPLAPILVFFLPGLWRNICPMATTSLIPKKIKLSRKIKMTTKTGSYLQLLGVVLLFILAPLRHVGLNMSGELTGWFLITAGVTAIVLGAFFENKSAWCSGICPVHPVEKLYGAKPLFTFENIQCDSCTYCVSTCPDSKMGLAQKKYQEGSSSKFGATIMYGAFPGFVWGWFQVQDYNFYQGLNNLDLVYGYAFAPALISFIIYILIKKFIYNTNYLDPLRILFATSSIILYYWFRIPQLVGLGHFKNDGMLVDLSSSISSTSILCIQMAVTLLLLVSSFLLSRKKWTYRPSNIEKETSLSEAV